MLVLDKNGIEIAAKIIRKGGIVAFPTDTVFGIGVDATQLAAIERLYMIKKRPISRPTSCQFYSIEQVKAFGVKLRKEEEKILRYMTPGPLTLLVPDTGFLPIPFEHLGIRISDNDICKMLVEKAKVPILAPSANLHGKPPAVNNAKVIEYFPNIDAVVKGQITYGLESTVIMLESRYVRIFRQGPYLPEDFINLGFKVEEEIARKENSLESEIYIIPYQGDDKKTAEKVKKLEGTYLVPGWAAGYYKNPVIMGNSLPEISRNLYEILEKIKGTIIVHGIEEKGLGKAIMERLKRYGKEIK